MKEKITKEKLKQKYPGIQFRYALFLEVHGYENNKNRNIEYMSWMNRYFQKFREEKLKRVPKNQDEFDEFLLKEVN